MWVLRRLVGDALVVGQGLWTLRGGPLICTRLPGRAAGVRQGPSEGLVGLRYICFFSSRMEATYCLVSANIPLFCTEYRPW